MSTPAVSFPPTATATVLGQWPGSDPVETAKVSLGLLTGPHLPGLAALPARGIGSDAVGRTAAMLVEMPVDVQPYGWRFTSRPGLDQRRAASALSTDLNVLADVVGAAGEVPAHFKVHLTGPLSLSAAIHLHYGERALQDHGARRDIAESLAAGMVLHAERVRAAVPGAALTLQIDEPTIAAVLAGTIPTASGYRTLRAVAGSELRNTWTALVDAARAAGFSAVVLNLARHAAPGSGPQALYEGADQEAAAWRTALQTALVSGVDAVAVPLQGLDAGHWEQLAGALESGLGVWAGTVPVGDAAAPPPYAVLLERILRPWRGLGLAEPLLNQLRITPEGELAGVSPQQGRMVLGRALEVADALAEIQHS